MYDRRNNPEMNTRDDEQCIISLVYYFCNVCFVYEGHVCMRISVYMFIILFNEVAITYLVFAIIS